MFPVVVMRGRDYKGPVRDDADDSMYMVSDVDIMWLRPGGPCSLAVYPHADPADW